MKLPYSLFILFFNAAVTFAQFPPPAGQPGSTAIHKDSAIFVNWARACSVNRGYMDISNPALGFASAGDANMATGKSGTKGTVSLGDGGEAVLTFEGSIINGEGWDFSVFENSFDDYFLELAFVEVSSDGENFFRFPSTSLTDTTTQIGSFDLLDATKLNNLAGKYRLFYGTPFDLEEMKDIPGLDVNNITHVKIIDAIGSINAVYASRDAQNNIINEPWKTPFASGGFDLDAIGVIHQAAGTGIISSTESLFILNLFPNPAKNNLSINFKIKEPGRIKIQLVNVSGECVMSIEDSYNLPGDYTIHAGISTLKNGLYFLQFINEQNREYKKLLIHN